MNNGLRAIGLVVVALWLTACASTKTAYDYVAPAAPEGERCVAQCHQSKQMCVRLCQDDNACMAQARRNAAARLADFKAANPEAADSKQLQDFLDTSGCKQKDACGCQEDYNACFTMCGGQLVPQRR